MAETLNKEGHYAEAEAIARETLDLERPKLGAYHPYTLDSLKQLGNVVRMAREGAFSKQEVLVTADPARHSHRSMSSFDCALRIPRYECNSCHQKGSLVMKEPNRVGRVSLFVTVVLLGSNLCFAQTPGAGSTPYTRSLSGLVGITSDQRARLTAVNASGLPEIFKLSLLDAAGNIVKALTATVQPGEAAFLTVTLDDAAAIAETRLELRGVVDTLPAVQNTPYPPDPCISTLEVIAADGHTIAVNPNFRIHALNPQPLPP